MFLRTVPGRARPLTAASVAAALLVASFAAPVPAFAGVAPAASSIPALPTAAGAQSAGASVPFTEYAAATSPAAATTGSVLPVDYQYGSLQAEATGRQAVELSGLGQSLSFTLTTAANAVDFHYAIPDSSSGGGLTEPLSMYVNGTLTTALSMTSDYSWLYGPYEYSNSPSVGEPGGTAGTEVPHDFYNDVRYKFSSTLPVGTVVKLQIDAGDDAPWYAINTADFETVAAPIAQPSGYVNVTSSPYSADATGANDSTSALQSAINAASSAGEGVYIPQGTYKIGAPLNVDNVTVEGAGQWYTDITGTNVEFNGNENPASTNVDISNLALYGDVSVRDNSNTEDAGFNGGFTNSTIDDVWIQNEKVGIWVYGPTTNLTIENVRIQDTTADGINLNAGGGAVTGSTVENNFIRNTGDDGIALWSESFADTDDTVTQNTVDSPGLANNMGIYGGGSGDQITNNLLQDTVQFGGGMEISQNYGSIPFSGTLTISGNELVRTGQFDPGWDYGTGAIWIYPAQGSMSSTINITGNTILNSPYEAIMFQNSNAYSGAATLTAPTTGNSVTGVNITDDTITNVGTYVFQDQAPGSATVSGTTATGVGVAGVFTCGSGFSLNQGSGDSGFSSTTCSMPSSSKLWAYPGVTTFNDAPIGTATSTQQIGIMNTSSAATTLGTITASSGFTVSADSSHPCGGALAAAAVTNAASWCMVDVSFTASKSGVTQGTLTINSDQPGPETVQLVGSTGTSAPDLALNKPTTTSSSVSGFPGSNAVDGNTGTYWEGANGTWPSTLSVNLGSSQAAASVELAMPPSWPTRTQTLSVLGSANGSSWTTLVSSATYTWNPSTGDIVSINLPANTTDQYLELSFTANNAQNGAQVAELEVLPGSGTGTGGGGAGSATLTASPASLSFGSVNVGSSGSAQAVTIGNTGSVAAAISSISAGSGYGETNDCGTSLAAGASCTAQVTFTPTAAGADSTNLTVNSNASNSTLTVGLSGTGTSGSATPINLALNQPATAGSGTSGFPAANAVDGNASTYWEGTNGTWPTTLAVDLGATDAISSVVVDLPSSWPTRTQTLSVLGSANDGAWTTLKASATYTWSSSNGDAVTIALPGGTSDRYVELSFTANNVQNGAQVAEFQVMGPANPNLALNAAVTASSAWSGYYAATSADDGDTATYWESTDAAWPATLTVNLGASHTLGSVVVDLPPGWATRTQTLSILGSANGSTWATLKASATYTWDPSTGDSVTIALPSGPADQYLELSFTANSVQNGAQVAEVEVFG